MKTLVCLLMVLLPAAGSAQDTVPVIQNFGTSAQAVVAKTITGLPSGVIVFVQSGSCPSGFTEVGSGNGAYILLTTSAAGDVGTTGGSNSYTPTGSVAAPTVNSLTAAAQTVNSLTAAAQVFTGSQTTASAVSAGTPAGTNSTGTVTPTGTIAWPAGVPTNASGAFSEGAISWPAGVPTFAGTLMGTHTHGPGTLADATSGSTVKLFTASASGVSAATLSGVTAATSAGTPAGTVAWPAGVPTIAAGSFTQPTISWPAGAPTFSGNSNTTSAQVFTGSALGTHTHTVTATGTNSNSAVTGTMNSSAVTGTLNAGAFTGNAATIQPAFIKLIGCRAN